VLLLSLISFAAIVVTWVVAPESKPLRAVEPTPAVPVGAIPARA